MDAVLSTVVEPLSVAPQRAVLLSELGHNWRSLGAVRERLLADSNPAPVPDTLPDAQPEAGQPSRDIAEGYRVYLILFPRVRLPAGAAGSLAALTKFDEVAGGLEWSIRQLEADGHDVTAARASAHALHNELAMARAALLTSAADLEAARAHARHAIAQLRSVLSAIGGGGTGAL